MINISEVLLDPIFLQPYQILRKSGDWVGDGVWDDSETTLDRSGSIQPASANDVITFVPEGLRANRSIRIWDAQSVFMGNGTNQMPDVILWNEGKYRVVHSKPWEKYGYWFAVAVEVKNGD